MRKPKTYLAFAAVVALMAVAPATSSAHGFFYYPGEFTHKAITSPVFTFGTQVIKCTGADGQDSPINLPGSADLEIGVTYSGCKGSNGTGVPVKVSSVRYLYNANGHIDLLNKLTFEPYIFGESVVCTITVEPQSNLSTIKYTNHWKLEGFDAEKSISGIAYSAKGVLSYCGGSSSGSGSLSGTEQFDKKAADYTFYWE